MAGKGGPKENRPAKECEGMTDEEKTGNGRAFSPAPLAAGALGDGGSRLAEILTAWLSRTGALELYPVPRG